MIIGKTKIYSVYARKDGVSPIYDAVFIKDGFNFWAFFFGALWFLYHRLWVAFALIGAITIGFEVAPHFFTIVTPVAASIIKLGFKFWLGFEASNIRAQTFTSRGYVLIDIVSGRDELEAQKRFYDKYFFSVNKTQNYTARPTEVPLTTAPDPLYSKKGFVSKTVLRTSN